MDWLWLRRRWTMVLLLLLLIVSVKPPSTVAASGCPEGINCGACHSNPAGVYEIACTTSQDHIFKLQISPGNYIRLDCPLDRATNWNDLDFGKSSPIEHINSLYFNHCDLPNDNRLEIIARQLLNDNVKILGFDSSKNLSTPLTREHLRSFRRIKKLILSNNNLSELPQDLLQDFSNLEILLLRENKLRYLPVKFLNSVPNLKSLELGINQLESLNADVFEKLEKLNYLNIGSNNLSELLPHTFDNLVSVTILDLHHNYLETLPFDIFARLASLEIINLSRNNFTLDSLSSQLFRNNSRLVSLSLQENKRNMTTLPGSLFANLTRLVTVKLRKNGLIYLPEDLFWGAERLENIGLERNYLSTLPSNIFRDSYNLKNLDLNFNDLHTLPDDVFSPLHNLTKLDLSRNHLTAVSENLFAGLLSLQELNMEMNDLTSIDFKAFNFGKHLRIAKFTNNSLTLRSVWYQQTSPFQSCEDLQELHLAYNEITEVFEDWKQLRSLRLLNLAHNRIQFLQGADLQYLSAKANNHVKVDFSYNNISYINMRTVELWATDNSSKSNWLTISIDNNPFRCDCSAYDVLYFLDRRVSANVQNAFQFEYSKLECFTPDSYRGTSISKLRSKEFKCDVNSPGLPKDIYCPDKCHCELRPEDKAFLIDCADKGLNKAPERIGSLPYHHVELNLSGNFLTKMPDFDLPGYENVTILTLDHNRISGLSVNRLSNNLKVLQLNNNNLTKMDAAVIDFLKYSSSLNNLTLQANPWMCDCETRDFLNFIQAKRTKLPDLMKITCQGRDKPISEMTPEEMCPVEIEWIIGGCLVVAFLGILIGSFAALYYRYQREIKVWLYARQWCLWFVTEDELDRDKLYDAFISYSHKDEEFVVNNLLGKLEEGPRPFKLCIHFRDWFPGEWIPKQIVRSVQDSRRTIIVLSPNFLESVWGRMEFRAAHSQALTEGRARVIVVLYGDIGPTENLDPELKAYLTMNTYVKWGDPWFWEKLKYALPHPPSVSILSHHSNKKSNVFETIQPGIHIINDKSELINTASNAAAIPSPGASTPPADVLKLFVPNNDSEYNQFHEILSVNRLNSLNSVKCSPPPTAGNLPIAPSDIDSLHCTSV